MLGTNSGNYEKSFFQSLSLWPVVPLTWQWGEPTLRGPREELFRAMRPRGQARHRGAAARGAGGPGQTLS